MLTFLRLTKWMATVDVLFKQANIDPAGDRVKTRFTPELESDTGPPFLQRISVSKEFEAGRGSIVWQAEAAIGAPCALFTFTATFPDSEVQIVQFALVANAPASAEHFELRVKHLSDAAANVIVGQYETDGFKEIEGIFEDFIRRTRELPKLQAM